MKKLFFVVLMSIVVGVLVFTGCASQTPATSSAPAVQTLKIGAILGLTGPGSQMFLAQKESMQLAQDWINNKGGITVNGQKYQIQVIFEDNKNTAADSITAATRLISQEGVKFIVSGQVPDQVNAIASVTEKNKVLYAAGGIDFLHPDWPLTFILRYPFLSVIPGLYDTLRQYYPNVKNMGYIVADEGGARATGDVSQATAKSLGLNTLEPQSVAWGGTEYTPQWNKLMSLKPDAVDVGLGFPDSTATAVKQGRQAGFTGPIIAETSADPILELNMIGKDYATDFIFPSLDVYSNDATPMLKEVVGLWSQTHQDRFDLDTADAFDAIWIVTQVIEKAQSLDPATVAKTWENLQTIDTTRGVAKMGGGETFGINHMVFQLVPISRLQNGQAEFIRWLDPWMP